jgi:multidrug efflux pump subunit AcrA (membrane-fusion protein)
MDLGAYWQENKRFVVSVGAGVLVFLIGYAYENAHYQSQINAAQRAITQKKNELAKMQFSSADQAEAETQNAALRGAVEKLSAAAQFHPRKEFVPDPAAGSSANHYVRTVSRVREELLQRANRAGLKLESSLGMPELSPTLEREILRYLEALDLVETVSDLAIRARAESIDKIQVRLDPSHGSGGGPGAIERTKVQVTLTGSSLALTRLLAWSQRPGPLGRVLPIDQVEMTSARNQPGRVRLDVTFVLALVQAPEPPEKG